MRPNRATTRAFTLIELLTVIAIISLLMAIILPSMSEARKLGKVTVCLSNLRELGVGIKTYSMNNEGAIPRGPNSPFPYGLMWDQWPSNQVWIGSTTQYNALGLLLASHELSQPKVLYCPGDDSEDPATELAKLENLGSQDVYTSYLYRQRCEQTRDRFDDMGFNSSGRIRAIALAMDMNSLGPPPFLRTDHDAKKVNIVYLSGNAQTVRNVPDHRPPTIPPSTTTRQTGPSNDAENGVLTLRAVDFAGLKTRLNDMCVAADVAESGDPGSAPYAVP